MPEPIIEPTTIVVESNRPRPRTKPASCLSARAETADAVSGISFGEKLYHQSGRQGLKPLRLHVAS